VVLIASGSEVTIAMDARNKLATKGVRARLVSMPTHELFAAQADTYRNTVLPPGVPRVAVEAGHPMSWYRWVGSTGAVVGLERFGASAPAPVLYKELGITADRVVEAALAVQNAASAAK
jgi:transketolase